MPERIRVGQAPLHVCWRERRDGGRLVERKESVELLGERRFGVVALQFGGRTVDDPDEALEPG
jgi:hypothetical protein